MRALLSVICTMGAGLVLYHLTNLLGLNLIKSEKVIADAKRDGTFTEAVLKRSLSFPGNAGDPDPERRMPYWAVTYAYTVGRKTYYYRRRALEAPPDTLTLYYNRRKPKQAYAEDEHVPGKVFWGIYFLMAVTFLVCYWVVFSGFAEIGT